MLNHLEWKNSVGLINYVEAVQYMEDRVKQIINNEGKQLVWLLEHPPIYTAGTSAKDSDLINQGLFKVYKTNRGGQYTYHGPGQLIVYFLLDLKQLFLPNQPDLRSYINKLEELIIRVLAVYNIKGERRANRIGVWVVDQQYNETKIAAIGVRVKKWVSYHGISININPNLQHFQGIIPCGLNNYGVTSMQKLGINVKVNDIKQIIMQEFYNIFTFII